MPDIPSPHPVLTREKVPSAAMPLHVLDIPVGLHAVMQCLLWPFWCDTQRSHLSHGHYRQLWIQSVSKPQITIRLDKMLQWASITRKWRALHTPPTPEVILQDLLRSHKSDACSGEWGTHPHVLKEVGARALIPDACMCLQIVVQSQHTTLQACVDDWGDMPSRPCVIKPAETVFLALKHSCRGNNAGRLIFSDLEATIHLPVAATYTNDIFPVAYQARSLVIRDDNADVRAFRALHRRKREAASAYSALESFALLHPHAASVLLVALRRCDCQGSDSRRSVQLYVHILNGDFYQTR